MSAPVKLRLNPNPTFNAPVSITVPGQVEPATLTLIFRHRTDEQFAALLASSLTPAQAAAVIQTLQGSDVARDIPAIGGILTLIEREAQSRTDKALCHDVVAGWVDGPEADDGTPVAFTDAALRQLLSNYTPAAREIVSQYARALTRSSLGN